MGNSILNEAQIENLAINNLKELGYKYSFGPEISPGGGSPERDSFSEVILISRLRKSLKLINPKVKQELLDQAVSEIKRTPSPELIHNNEHFHYLLCNGMDVEYSENGNLRAEKIHFIDFNNAENNDFLVVNQFTIIENEQNCRLHH